MSVLGAFDGVNVGECPLGLLDNMGESERHGLALADALGVSMGELGRSVEHARKRK